MHGATINITTNINSLSEHPPPRDICYILKRVRHLNKNSFRNLCSLRNIINLNALRNLRHSRTRDTYGREQICMQNFVWKTQRGPFLRCERRQVDIIKMDFKCFRGFWFVFICAQIKAGVELLKFRLRIFKDHTTRLAISSEEILADKVTLGQSLLQVQ